MKELQFDATFQTTFENVVEEFYGDDTHFIKTYHKEINQDNAVVIEPWDATKSRSIMFTPMMPMPSVVKRAIGIEGDGVQVRERQVLQYAPGTPSAHLTSVSTPQLKGGERFITTLEIQYQASDGKCTALITVKIQAEVWGVTGMLEKFMSDQAAVAFKTFLDFSHKWFADKFPQVQMPLPQAPSMSSEMDLFFDAVDSGSMPNSLEIYGTFQSSTAQAREAGEEQPERPQTLTVDSWFMHSVMRDLSELRVSATTMRSTAMANELHLQRLQMDVERLRWEARSNLFHSRLQTMVIFGGLVFIGARVYMQRVSR